MNNDAFARAMNQIVNEAETQRQEEARTQRRRELFGKARRSLVFLFGATVIGFGFYHRQELQQFVSSKLDTRPQVDGQTSGSLTNIQAQAARRDQALDEITRK